MGVSNAMHVGLVGTGGFGREVMPLLRRAVDAMAMSKRRAVVCFVETEPSHQIVNGVQVMSEAEFLGLPGERLFNVAVGNSKVRAKIAERFIVGGARPISIQADNVRFLDANEIGEGAIFCGYSMVTSNARIGRFFHANIYAYVAHDCVIGDFVTFSPGVKCNGNVVIEDHAYIGTGAVLKQGTPEKPLRIGRGAVIGMGAVVTKDVPEGVTVVGNPARPLPEPPPAA